MEGIPADKIHPIRNLAELKPNMASERADSDRHGG